MPIRIDYEYIEEHVPRGARVLDLGCGDGSLLEQLVREKDADARGIDIDTEAVQACISRGVPVYHGDMLEGMAMFADGTFDCVILSQTLQQALAPAAVIDEMMRVGRRAIISFPNFGHWQLRLQLLLRGRMPVTRVLPHKWHSTPNVHLLTIRDFVRLCSEKGLRIVDRMHFSPSLRKLPTFGANLLASLAIFVVEKAGGQPRPPAPHGPI